MALNTTTPNDQAKLIHRDQDVNSNGFTLKRMWDFIDATVADTLVDTRVASSPVSNPQADGQTYTGTFVIAKVFAKEADGLSDDNNERYVNIEETNIKVSAPADASTLASLEPIIQQGNEIITGFSWEDGEEDDLRYIYKNVNPTSRATLMAISDADLVSNISGAGWTYIDREFTEEENNTGTFVVFFKKETWTNETGTTPDQTIARTRTIGLGNYDPQNDKSGVNRTKTTRSEGIPIADLEEIRDNQVAESGYAINRIQAIDNKNGSGTIGTRQVKKRATTDQFVVGFTSEQGVQAESQTVTWHDLSETDADTVYNDAITNEDDMTGATPASPASHVLRSVTKPIKEGIDSAGKQLFGVRRTTYKPRVKWLAQLNQQEEITGWRYEVVRFQTQDKYGYETSFPRVVRTDLKITTSKGDAKTWADAGSRHPISGRLLSTIEYKEGAGVYRSKKVLVSTTYTSATPFTSADSVDTWLASTIPA